MNAAPPIAAKQFGLLSYVGTDDLGDEIQSIAARQFLPRVDWYVDREGMNLFGSAETGKVWLIANGGFLHRPENWPPSQHIRPLWVSMHISKSRSQRSNLRPQDVILSDPAVKCLKGYGPVGARDLHTLDLLRRSDVDSYFSGCLTLTLQPPPVERRDDLVVLNDVPEPVASRIRQRTSKTLVETSHRGPAEAPVEDRFAHAEGLLQTYAEAGCVITTRLHCALPSLAFGTPVLLLDTAEDRYQLSGLTDFMNHCTIDEFLSERRAFDIDRPPPNAERHKPYAEALRRRVAEFVDMAEETDPQPYPLSLSDRYAIIAATQGKALQAVRQRKLKSSAVPVAPSKKTVLLQTSDAHIYAPMLQETARVNKVYCARHGLEYQCFIGVKRGFHPWQATFNRIPLLAELQQAGHIGWVIYLDADAYVYDLEFDVHAYLADKADRVCIAASGGSAGKWMVNAGVLFINLQHPLGPKLVDLWSTVFATTVSDEELRVCTEPWSTRENDQGLLHRVLREHNDILDATLVESGAFINYAGGLFIRQMVRAPGASMLLRLQRAASDARTVLSRIPATSPNLAAVAERSGAAYGPEDTRLYALLFEQLRNRNFSFLHVGALADPAIADKAAIASLKAANLASVQTWLDYFPQAQCLDVNAHSNENALNRTSFVHADLSRPDGWREIANEVPQLGIVIDTGAHGPKQQQQGFLALFRRLQSGGHYVMEDPMRGGQPLAAKAGGSTADLFLGYLTGGTLAIAGVKPYEIDECVRRIGQVYIDRGTHRGADAGPVQRVVVVAK